MEVDKMDILDDEMVGLMQEALSDDLWERYDEKIDNSQKELIYLWNKDIVIFKQQCKKLGYNVNDINKIVDEIKDKGNRYLEF